MKKHVTEYYFRAYELARILLEHPNMKVGIRTKGKFRHSNINHVEIREWTANDAGCLITSEEQGKWIFLDAKPYPYKEKYELRQTGNQR